MRCLAYCALGFVIGSPLNYALVMLKGIHEVGGMRWTVVPFCSFLLLLVVGLTIWALWGSGDHKVKLAEIICLVTGVCLACGLWSWFFVAFPLV